MTERNHEKRVRDAFAALEPERPDPAFRARLAREFAEGRLDAPPPQRVRPPRRRWLAFTFATAAAALVLLFLGGREERAWVVTHVDGPGSLRADGGTVDLAALAPGDPLPARGSWTVTGSAVEVALARTLSLRLNPGTQIALADPGEKGTFDFRIEAGEALFRTGPGFEGRRLGVETPEGIVRVSGTTFAVLRDEGVTCVCVLEGGARVGIDEADLESVPPGKRKVLFGDGRAPEILDVMPEHRAGLVDFAERARF